MVIDALKGEDLPKVWEMLQEEKQAHFSDGGPETFEAFLDVLNAGMHDGSMFIFAVRVGAKLAGAVGFNPIDKQFKGIAFAPEFQNTPTTVNAMKNIITHLWALGNEKLYLHYFITNRKMPGFLRKLGAKWDGIVGQVEQNGTPVQLVQVSFEAPPLVELAQ